MDSTTYTDLVKILFEPQAGSDGSWHDQVESMWAKPVSASHAPGGIVYELDNSPWYAFGVSWHDEICAELRKATATNSETSAYKNLYFTEVWKCSGHPSYLIFLEKTVTTESADFLSLWEKLASEGCTYEGMNSRLLSVDVPHQADLKLVEDVFEVALAMGIFEYQTQHRHDPTEVLPKALV